MFTLLDQKLPGEVLAEIRERAVRRRRALKLSQQALAKKSGVSLGSVKRFETTSQISLISLVKISFALGCEDDFDMLFSRPAYTSIEDVIAARRRAIKRGEAS